jgi:hypothetical protein
MKTMKLWAACFLLSLMLEVTSSFLILPGTTKGLSSLGRFGSSLSSQSTNTTSSTDRYYLEGDEDGKAKKNALLSSGSNKQLAQVGHYNVPVLGPLLQGPPLLIGAVLFLDPPTQIQWKTIEECVEIHSQARDQEKKDSFNLTTAVLDSAPLVAILDGDQSDGCYATLAAIVGLTTAIGKPYSADSKIRLLGIGRAKLTHFEKVDTDNGPVVMARMDLLQDEAQSGDAKTSPVHGVSEMATWASRIGYLHQDLRTITQGLQAANVRLQMASKDWQDHDGIGNLFFKEEGEYNNVQQKEEEGTSTKELQDKIDAMLTTFVQTGQSRPLSEASARLLTLENFGLGSSPASLEKLEPLTSGLIERLQPYYSPKCLSTEEFYYGVYSFVALTSVQSYLDRSDLTWALRSVDTIDRLKRVHGWMEEHKRLLQEVAESKYQELKAPLSSLCRFKSLLSSHSTDTSTAPIYYLRGDENGDADEHSFSSSGSLQQEEHYTVPVIGPLLQGPPLLIGADLLLNPPTPIQWKTIEECVEIHSLARNNTNLTTAVLDAAPLVAIMDGDESDGCYATLAAIVGVTVNLDTPDADSFRESLAKIGVETTSGKTYSADSKIRLLGVGRVKLTHFANLDTDTDEGPVVVARIDLLQDEAQSGGAETSPHVVWEMATWATRIGYMHQDLRTITQGLQAANIRLQLASEGGHNNQQQEEDCAKELQDKIDAMLATFVQTGQSRPLSEASARLLTLENFGLGYSPASSGKLEPLTSGLMERLQPYYSPNLLSTEEFYYGVYSFVALTSLQSYVDRSDLTWALRSVDTIDRLKQVYGWMEEHKRLLLEVAESKSQELKASSSLSKLRSWLSTQKTDASTARYYRQGDDKGNAKKSALSSAGSNTQLRRVDHYTVPMIGPSSLSKLRSWLSTQKTDASTARSYRQGDDKGNAKKSSLSSSGSNTQLRRVDHYTVPVIGPLLRGLPLLIGADLFLNPPTPIQWKTIEQCVESHSQARNSFNLTTAVLDAAPLVAIMDGDESDGCYATLAAIVGVTGANKEVKLDTTDADSFRESLAKIVGGTTIGKPLYSADSKIRLLGIGRAKLTHFEKVDTDEGPVLMARIDLLQDEAQAGTAKKSPVHVVSEMATWASRIGFIHQDRRKLTQGLQAANVRLQLASKNWQDHDGIGDLVFKELKEQGNRDKVQQQEEEEGTSTNGLQDKIDAMLAIFVQTGQSRPLSEASARLLKLENFGLGNSPASLEKLEPLTSGLIERLQPYYSPELLSTEEFYYGVYSFVALTSLQSYLYRSDLTWALRSVDTIDRLKQVYGWMDEHKWLLKEVAVSKSQELSDCGEEFTDLW